MITQKKHFQFSILVYIFLFQLLKSFCDPIVNKPKPKVEPPKDTPKETPKEEAKTETNPKTENTNEQEQTNGETKSENMETDPPNPDQPKAPGDKNLDMEVD